MKLKISLILIVFSLVLVTAQVNQEILFGDNKIGSFISEDGLINSQIVDGNLQIETVGKGDLEIQGTELKGISNGNIFINADNEINFAEFTSVDGGLYEFNYQGEMYSFNVQEGGKILFDPENGKIIGEKGKLEIYDSILEGDNFEINFEDDLLKDIKLSGGGKFLFGDKEFSSNEEFSVFLDGRDIENFEGHAISISDNEYQMKGEVSLKDDFNYLGLDESVYTRFNDESNLFEVQHGNSEIDNNKHKILVKDGKVLLSKENLFSDNEAESFTVSYKGEDDETRIFLDEIKGELQAYAIKEGEETAVAVIPLEVFQSEVKNELFENPNEIVEQAERYLEQRLIDGASKDEIEEIELGIIAAKNLESNTYGMYDESERRLMEFLENEDLDETSKGLAYLSLAEIKKVKGEELDSGDLISQFEYDSSIRYYEEAITNLEINSDEYINAQLGLSEIYLKFNDANSLDRANIIGNEIINDPNIKDEFKSRAYVDLSLGSIKSGRAAESLRLADKALERVPSNEALIQYRENLRDSMFNNIGEAISGEIALLEEKSNDRIFTDDNIVKNLLLTPPTQRIRGLVGYENFLVDIANDANNQLSFQAQGALLTKNLRRKGYSYDDIRDISAAEIATLYNVNSNQAGEMRVAITEIYGNPDVKNLLSKDYQQDFYFETGKGYVDSSFLDKNWQSKTLDFVNPANAAIFLGPGATIKVAGKSFSALGIAGNALRATPGISRGVAGIEKTKTTLAGLKILESMSKKHPKIVGGVNFLGANTAEAGTGYLAEKLVPGSGIFIEVLTGHSRVFDLAEEISQARKYIPIRTGTKFIDYDGQYYHGIQFNKKKDLDQFVHQIDLKKLRKIDENLYITSEGYKVYLFTGTSKSGNLVIPKSFGGKEAYPTDYTRIKETANRVLRRIERSTSSTVLEQTTPSNLDAGLQIGRKEFLDYVKSEKLNTYELNQRALEDDLQVYFSKKGDKTPFKFKTYYAYQQLRNMGRVFDVDNHLEDGKFIFYGEPASSTGLSNQFMYTIDRNGNFNIGYRDDRGISELNHGFLAKGQPVIGAGEVYFRNGEVYQVDAFSGHYVDFSGRERFNINSVKAFKKYAEIKGLKFTDDVRFIISSPYVPEELLPISP
jgi:hypothetical protein